MPFDGNIEGRDPELDVVELNLIEAGETIDRWESYSFASDYLTPADGFEFILGDELTPSDLEKLQPGAEVALKVNGLIQATGYIDGLDCSYDRRGSHWRVSGRDTLGYVVDAVVDPRFVVSPTATLEEFLLALFGTLGVVLLVPNNDSNRDQLTGVARRGAAGQRTTSKKGKPLKSVIGHQIKPYPQEGVFAFAARVCQRHGLWIQPSFDGSGVVVGRPDYLQAPLYALRHSLTHGENNNIIRGSVSRDAADQPSVILASGIGGGGEFAKASLRAAAINPMVNADLTAVRKAWGTRSTSRCSTRRRAASPMAPSSRPRSRRSALARSTSTTTRATTSRSSSTSFCARCRCACVVR
jgi:prophage tail gpP-like protein